MVQFCIAPGINGSSGCFKSLPEFGVARLLNFGHCNRYTLISCCLNLQFPDDIWCWISLHMLICPVYIFCGEVSVQVFGLFCNQVACFLIIEGFFLFIFISWRLITLQYCSGFCVLLSFKHSLYILDNSLSLNMYFPNIFSLSVACLLIPLT